MYGSELLVWGKRHLVVALKPPVAAIVHDQEFSLSRALRLEPLYLLFNKLFGTSRRDFEPVRWEVVDAHKDLFKLRYVMLKVVVIVFPG